MRRIVTVWAIVLFVFGIFIPVGVNADNNLASDTPASEIKATVNLSSGTLNMRKNDSSSAPIVTKIPNQAIVMVEIKGEEWCKVRFEDKTGYVMTKFLLFDSPTPEHASDIALQTATNAPQTGTLHSNNDGNLATATPKPQVANVKAKEKTATKYYEGAEYVLYSDGTAELVKWLDDIYEGSKRSYNGVVLSAMFGIFPDKVYDYIVTHIGESALENKLLLMDVILLPNNIEHIGDRAFYNAIIKKHPLVGKQIPATQRITHMSFPDSLKSIGKEAFRYCDSLTGISFGEGLKTIGDNAFAYCIDLRSISFSEGLETIGDSAFTGCNGLDSITIPESVTSVGSNAFGDCSNLLTCPPILVPVPELVEI